MPSVQSGHRGDLPALGDGHDRGIHGAKGKIPIGGDELGDTKPVRGSDRFSEKVPSSEVPEEADLGVGAQAGCEQ